jgi:hypothetical protein
MPTGRADSTATSLLHRLLLGHARSAGIARGWPRRRIDRSRQRHKASETTGQTRAAATIRIIAVKTSTALA